MLPRILNLFLLGAAATGASAPAPNPDVTFHAPPKPLPAGRSRRLGGISRPTYNMVSPETKLLKNFPRTARAGVGAEQGDGYAAPAVAGDRLVLFHRVGDQAVVDCLPAADGRRFLAVYQPDGLP